MQYNTIHLDTSDGLVNDKHNPNVIELIKLRIRISDSKNGCPRIKDTRFSLKSKRKKSDKSSAFFLTIYALQKSSLSDVGLQLWLGSLALGDFILQNRSIFDNAHVVEFGTGCGLLGVVLSMYSSNTVLYLTDYCKSILDNVTQNLEVNAHNGYSSTISVSLKILDWCTQLDMNSDDNSTNCMTSKYEWTPEDKAILYNHDIIYLAADVIYDDDLTIAFFTTLEHMMKPTDVLYLSMEKRYNFEIKYMNTVAHGYDLFLSFIDIQSYSTDIQSCVINSRYSTDPPAPVDSNNTILTNGNLSYINTITNDDIAACINDISTSICKKFIGMKVCMDTIPQRLYPYTRHPHIELWEIRKRG